MTGTPTGSPMGTPAATPAHPRWLRRTAIGLGALGALAAVALLGPRNSFGPEQATPRAAPPTELAALENWLADSEAKVPNLRPGTAKQIIWAGAEKKRRPLAIVYVHGFSATRQETAPLADEVAAGLDANLFYTRLTGHGQGGDDLGKATVQDWLADADEALAIGRLLGEKVIVIGCSTGATLMSWQGLYPQGRDIGAFVFISPNFGPRDARADITNWPWGRELVRVAQGAYREWHPDTQPERDYWTTRYPTHALYPMMALVKAVRETNLGALTQPTLMLYSERDEVISPAQVRDAFARFGSPIKQIEAIDYSASSSQHVLAGRIKSPDATTPMAQTILRWLHKLPATPSVLSP